MWYTATSASISNGSTIVQILAGDDIGIVQEDGGLIFESESPVQVKRGYTDGSGNNYIELQSPWPYLDKLEQPLVVYPTDASFAEATAELRRVIDTLEVASTTDMQTATNDVKISTPLKVKQAIDFHAYNKAAADAEFVSRSDILGTVSQSGGLPTGAIIESGSNANGQYTKYADGTLVCEGVFTYTQDISTATGMGYQSSTSQGLTFPSVFISTPSVSTGSRYLAGTARAWNTLSSLSNSSFAVLCHSFSANTSVSIEISYLAIGRWF